MNKYKYNTITRFIDLNLNYQLVMSENKHYSYNTPTTIPPNSSSLNSSQQNSRENRRSMDVSGKRRIPREVRFGNYVLGSTLGEGEFGKVKLGWRKDGKNPSQAAIKLIKRDSIPTGSDKEGKIYREITALKKLRHPNIVRLVEVLQNDKYIGIVLEYASGGELFDYILDHRYLKESLACRLFAQLVSGVDYMHSKGIVHRDLKLENLLLDKHKNIIITDFGFVNSFQNSNNDLMKTSCGSPCYAAPELVVSSEPYEGKKVDVWSCGVILYAMLAGYLPFDDDPENPDGSNIARLYHYITHTSLTFPEYIQPTPRDLLRRILVSNPNKRISLREIRSHIWLAPHAPFLSVTPIEWDRNYRSSKVLTQQDKINRRMSLMENPTSASLMLNKQNVRSYSTQNVQASLYSNPAAPQTSRTVAIPSAETSPVTSPVRQTLSTNANSSNNLSSSLNSNTNTSISNTPGARHSRSGSTASIALQAVVDADVEIKRRYSNGSSDILTTPVRNQRPISLVPMVSDNKNFETIKESPENKKMLPPPIPVFKQPANSTVKLPSSRTSKPRPTSYHPSHSSNVFNTSDLSFITNTNYSESSLRAGSGRSKIGNSSVFSSTSESLISTSLKETEPSDLENNVLKTKETNDNASGSTQTEINSSVTTKLANAMDSLLIVSKYPTQTSKNEQDQILTLFPNNEPLTKPRIANETSIHNELSEKSENSMMLNALVESDESEKENYDLRNRAIQNQKRKVSPSSGSTKSVTNASAGAAATTKYKRFSLLTFYQSIPEPTAASNHLTSLNNTSDNMNKYTVDSENITPPFVGNAAQAVESSGNLNASHISNLTDMTSSQISQSQRKVSTNSVSSTKVKSIRKPLEPSNVKSERRVSSINVHDKTEKLDRDTSTARKVMDFFKRRSMRI